MPVVPGLHGHVVGAHTALQVAAALQELHWVDAPAEGPCPGRQVGMAREQGPCAEAGLGSDLDLAQVAEGHVPVHYQGEGVEEPELETDREPNTSHLLQDLELPQHLGKVT